MKDIVFNDGINKFNFRVAALIVQNNKILLQKCLNEDFYALVGGRNQFFEDTSETIIRECKEEIGVDIGKDNIKLIDVIENFFTYNNINYHELLFIYKVYLPSNIKIESGFKTLDKENNYNYWFDFKDIKDLNIKPVLIKDIYLNEDLNHHINKEI